MHNLTRRRFFSDNGDMFISPTFGHFGQISFITHTIGHFITLTSGQNDPIEIPVKIKLKHAPAEKMKKIANAMIKFYGRMLWYSKGIKCLFFSWLIFHNERATRVD